MAGHLWADAPAPIEFTRLQLCRDVYHCTPLELDNIPAQIIFEDLAMLSIENKVKTQRMR